MKRNGGVCKKNQKRKYKKRMVKKGLHRPMIIDEGEGKN